MLLPPWQPDWKALMAAAPQLEVPPGEGRVYLLADSHLGHGDARPGEFIAQLRGLQDARLVILLGDLFKVWLSPRKFWDAQAREVMEALHGLAADGLPLWLVVGNREFFLPRGPRRAARDALPFAQIIHDMATFTLGGRRYALTHGDVVNRRDAQYLKWRRIARSRPFEWCFRAMPAPLARAIARRLEGSLANTNRAIKIQYPEDELRAFAHAVLTAEGGPPPDGCLIGHFHRDALLTLPDGRWLRIVPDWLEGRKLLALNEAGEMELVG